MLNKWHLIRCLQGFSWVRNIISPLFQSGFFMSWPAYIRPLWWMDRKPLWLYSISGGQPYHLNGPLHSLPLSFPILVIPPHLTRVICQVSVLTGLVPQLRHQCSNSRYNSHYLPFGHQNYTTMKRNANVLTSDFIMELKNWAYSSCRDSSLRRI